MSGHEGLQLLLHGSLATCDATHYSDADTLLIISDEWLASAERVAALRAIVARAQRWLYRYDPLQHHGFMIVTQFDLDRYAHAYFPLELLAYAYPLGKTRPVRYRLRSSEGESAGRLRVLCDRLDKLERGERAAPETRYALKLALSELMLLPTFYLQATGQVMYKRESFRAVRGDLSAAAVAAMDDMSAWRREWRRGPWETAHRLLGAWLPAALAVRVLARARSARVGPTDLQRWRNLVTGARQMSIELALHASSVA